MEIYTSNYAKARHLNPEHYMLISISRTRPQNMNIAVIPAFAPSADLLSAYKSGRISWEQYTEWYKQDIEYIDIKEELDFCRYITKGRDIVLLCYEGKNKPCHRHILAEIIKERYGYLVREL